MEGKKRYVAIVLFLLIGLTLFTFANPVEEQKGSKGNGSKDTEVTDKDTTDGTLGTGESQTQVQPQVQNQVADTSYADALAAVVKAEGSLAELDVDTARDLINKVTNQNQKNELTERLDIVEEAIDAIELVETLEQMVEEATDRDGIEDSIDYRTDKEIIQLVDALRNEDVQESLKDRLQILSRILDDTTAPEYDGVEDNEITNKDISLTYSDTDEETGTENEVTVTVTLDGEEIDYTETFTKEGTYVVTLRDEAFNETTVTFTIDKTAPKFVDLKNGKHYETIEVEVDDETATIVVKNVDKNESTEVANGTVLTEDATYYITATDEAGNETAIWVAIDTTAPTITGIDETKPTNKNEIVYVKDKFLTSVTIDGKEYTREDFEVGANNENFSFQKKVTHEGTHTVVAKDKFGNTTTKTFVIDKTAAKQSAVNANVNGYKNEVKEQYATNGNTVTAYISVNEELKHNPTFTFYTNGKEVKVVGKEEVVASKSKNENFPYVYTAKLVINEELVAEDGVITFKVSDIFDKAGNQTPDLTKMSVGNKVLTLDRTAPERVYSTVRVNKTEYEENGTKYYYVKNGDSFEFAISFNELLKEVPTVTIAGRNVEMKLNEKVLNNENKFLYEGTFSIAADEKELKEGTLEIKVSNVKDIVGNEATSETVTNQTKTSNGRTVIYDRTAPKPHSTTYSPKTPTNGNVTVTIRVNEALKPVEGWTLSEDKKSISKEFTENTKGSVVISDLAGNTKTRYYKISNIDRVAAKLVSANMYTNGNKYIEGENTIYYATNGNTITAYIRVNEQLGALPTFTFRVNGKDYVINNAKESFHKEEDKTNGIYKYEVTFKIEENLEIEDGEVSFTVSNIKDKAGNTTEDVKGVTNKFITKIDRTNPTLTVKEESVGTDPYYSEISFKLYDNLKIDYFTVNGTKFDRSNAQWSDANYQNIKSALVEGENTIVLYDIAGNKTTKTFYMDWTKATINLAGTEGLNKNEMRVESGTEVTLEDVLATVTDNFDETTQIKPYKADLLISNVASENTYNYDFSNGFNTRHIGRYNIYYEYTDKAGNKSTATMLLVMTDTTPATITLPENGQAGRNNNEMHVESGTEVTLEDVLATVTDNVDETVKIAPYKADLLISNVASENTYNYDFTNGFDTRYVGRYNIYYTYTDKAGHVTNKTMLLVMTDTTAPTISIPGTAGLNKNEYIVEAGTHVTVDEIMATVTDNVDATIKIKPYRADLLIGTASENTYNYDFTNGFDTYYSAGRYNLYYEYTDKAGHTTKAGMMIVIKDTTAPTITVKESSVGVDNIYSKLDLKLYDKIGVDYAIVNGEEVIRQGNWVDIDDGHAWHAKNGINTITAVDKAGNKTTTTFIVDKNTFYVTTFEDLKAAFAAGGKIKLMNNIEVTEMLTLVSGKELVLDMNGKKLTISDSVDPMMDIKSGSKITIKGNGTFDLEDHKYASLMYPRGEVIIENGNFLRATGTNKKDYGSFFIGISGSAGRAKIRIYDGYFDGGYYVEGDEFNNSRTMLNGSWGQDIKVYGGTFVGQNPAYGDEGMAYTNPNSTSTYCQTIFFEGQTRLDTEIPSTYKVEKGTLADGRPTYKVIYTPSN